MATKLRAEIEAAKANPNVLAMLNAIGKAEGADYNTFFGGSTFNDFSKHPGRVFTFKQTDGKQNRTTAAGKYQFLESTWNEAAKALALKDFSPESQDLAAIYLIKRRGALDDTLKGDFAPAVQKLGKEWASLPSSPYAQPKRSAEFMAQALGAPVATQAAVAQAVPAQAAPAPVAAQTPAKSADLMQMAEQEIMDGLPPGALAAAAAPAPPPAAAPVAPAPDWLASLQAMTAGAGGLTPVREASGDFDLLAQIQNQAEAQQDNILAAAFGDVAEAAPEGVERVPSAVDRYLDKLLAG